MKMKLMTVMMRNHYDHDALSKYLKAIGKN